MIQGRKKIFVGISGGVDSSVSAALLQQQGHDVVGVFIRTWQPDFVACTWKQERRDAISVCAHLNIPFIELDLEDAYKQGVADYMISEYQQGRTPNPDVMCNKEVKFGGFLAWARTQGADYVATGHYVQVTHDEKGSTMYRGADQQKDQSYFLWTLTQEQLQQVLFPVGSLQKSEVRELARSFALPTATKKDSQGICFIGDIDMKAFLRHFLELHEGEVMNEEHEVIGRHDGSLLFTIGERHGFDIFPKYKHTDDKPYYVQAKDVQKNTITVSQKKPVFDTQTGDTMSLISVVDNQGVYTEGTTYEAQFRYRGDRHTVTITSYDPVQQRMDLRLHGIVDAVAPGQSVVLYTDTVCLGGGIIE